MKTNTNYGNIIEELNSKDVFIQVLLKIFLCDKIITNKRIEELI